jgi:hypothetical protein
MLGGMKEAIATTLEIEGEHITDALVADLTAIDTSSHDPACREIRRILTAAGIAHASPHVNGLFYVIRGYKAAS